MTQHAVTEWEPASRAPRKSLGQHFLVDQGALRRVLAAADVKPTDVVVEVGPGTGLLTKLLAETESRVIAVELDSHLATRLSRDLSGFPNVEIVHADAREWDPAVVDAPYKVVANLPYYAATPIVRRFLESPRPPSLMVVTVQREVAQSMTAAPGKMKLLSVGVQLYGRPRTVGYIRPGSFSPPPKVTSAIVRIDVHPKPALALDDTESFFRVVRAGFSGPRKQLRNSLGHAFELTGARTEELLLEAGIDYSLRAEALSLEQWDRIHAVFGEQGLC